MHIRELFLAQSGEEGFETRIRRFSAVKFIRHQFRKHLTAADSREFLFNTMQFQIENGVADGSRNAISEGRNSTLN